MIITTIIDIIMLIDYIFETKNNDNHNIKINHVQANQFPSLLNVNSI